MNYATIGCVVGHELSHGFDDQGNTTFYLKCIQNNDDRELSSFALTAFNILNKLTVVRAKLNSSLSSLF